jgi:hypothetical protein
VKPLRVSAVFAALVLASCVHTPPWSPVSGDACEAAGANLLRLQCRAESGAPLWETPGHIPYSVVCRDRAAHGRNTRPDCVARESFTCAQLDDIIELPEVAPCPR